jgi:hypothetical protein
MGIFKFLKQIFYDFFCDPSFHVPEVKKKKKEFLPTTRRKIAAPHKFTGHVDKFIKSRLILDDSWITGISTIYLEYVEWCGANDVSKKSKACFCKELIFYIGRKNVFHTKVNGIDSYSGIGLRRIFL